MSQLQQAIDSQPCYMGKDLRLRQFRLSDANDICKLHQDSLMTRWLLDNGSFDKLRSVTGFTASVCSFYRKHPGLGIWALDKYQCRYTREQLATQGTLSIITEEAANRLLRPVWQLQGWFNLTPVPGHPDQIELGARLHRASWGQGVACTVGQQLVDYAFNILSVQRLYLQCHPLNGSALYCAAYLGFDYPEPVRTRGSKAIKLSLAAHGSQGDNSCTRLSDNQRRRIAINRVRRWTHSTAMVTA